MWLIISAILVVGTAIWDKATPIELLTGIIGSGVCSYGCKRI